MSLITQIAALATRVAAEIKLLRTEIPPDLPTYVAGTPTEPTLTYDFERGTGGASRRPPSSRWTSALEPPSGPRA